MTAKPSLRPERTLRLLAFLVLATTAEAASTSYRGEARDADGALVYTEEHQVRSTQHGLADSVTEYRAPDGTLIATLRSDYSRSLALPTYVFEDLRRDYREGLRWQEGAYVVFHQQGGEPEKSAPLRTTDRVFSCQGWHYYLIENLALLERERVTLELVLPSELRAFPFAVRSLAADRQSVSAELSLRHWLFRYFAPKMRLDYDRENRRLREYHGLSNLLSASGERQTVTIRYLYPEQ